MIYKLMTLLGKIFVSSDYPVSKLSKKCANLGLAKTEFLSGIPGTVGGAIRMNAGAHGKEMKDVVLATQYIDTNAVINTITNKDHEFEYRNSIFAKKRCIILETTLQLQYGSKENIKSKMQEYLEWRRQNQPLEYPNAGSTFKRGDGFITAKLIVASLLTVYRIGGAEVSRKHAGFIINYDNATAEDILKLVEYVQKIVYEKFN